MGPRAPTFSSTGDPRAVVTKLGLARIGSLMLRGSLHIPFPSQYNVDPQEFVDGAKDAVGMVTSSILEDDWDSLEGLVDPECIKATQKQLQDLKDKNRQFVKLNPSDVLFSFISTDPNKSKGGNSLNLVTFSFPGLEAMLEIRSKVKVAFAEAKKDSLDVEALKKVINGIEKEYSSKLEIYGSANSKQHFINTEIVIGNYKFVRSSNTEPWLITEIGQTDSLKAFNKFMRFKWRGRLAVHLKTGVKFLSFTRWDFVTDTMWIMILLTIITSGNPVVPLD